MVSAQPSIRFADGTEVGHNDGVHLHHAHLFRRDQDAAGQTDGRTGYQWIFGTGDEQTLGSFEALSKGDPSGKRYGVKLNREPMLMVWMPMNMTDQVKVVYLEFKFEFIHGSADGSRRPPASRSARCRPCCTARPSTCRRPAATSPGRATPSSSPRTRLATARPTPSSS